MAQEARALTDAKKQQAIAQAEKAFWNMIPRDAPIDDETRVWMTYGLQTALAIYARQIELARHRPPDTTRWWQRFRRRRRHRPLERLVHDLNKIELF